MMDRHSSKRRNNKIPECTLYPLHPPDSQVLLRFPETALTWLDRLAVASSSLFIVGSVVWVPLLYRWAWNKIRACHRQEDGDSNNINRNSKRRAKQYATLLFLCSVLAVCGPHRSPKFAKWLRIRKWKLWESWLKFIAMEVIADQPNNNNRNKNTNQLVQQYMDVKKDKVMYAFVPHGIFPFAFAFGVFPEAAQRVFGFFHPVVATATQFFPVVRDILKWCECVDASRASVDHALQDGRRIGIVPGGIAEMFEGYPKQNTSPDEEYSIVRKGFLRLAIRHGVPVIPVYCFGATKMFHRLQLPFLERLSRLLRVSLCLFFGVWGLPIPFRQRLTYVMGDPIVPPPNTSSTTSNDYYLEEQVDAMHQRFCNELLRLFERHKEAYGWGHKTLKLITR